MFFLLVPDIENEAVNSVDYEKIKANGNLTEEQALEDVRKQVRFGIELKFYVYNIAKTTGRFQLTDNENRAIYAKVYGTPQESVNPF